MSIKCLFIGKPSLPHSCPWLMLGEENEQSNRANNRESQTRCLRNLLDTKFYVFNFP